MKKPLLVIVLAVAVLGMLAAPALAYYAPQPKTAYITSFVKPGVVDWAEWNGPGDPFGLTEHVGPIPHCYNVVITREWFDTRLGATLIPAEYFNTMAISRAHGGWSFAITKPVCSLRYWSPAYEFGDVAEGFPVGTWARDWWVPLGKLRPGTYSGWVTQFAPHAVPTWIDWGTDVIPPSIRPLNDPIWLQPVADDPADSLNWKQEISFTVN